MYIFGKKDSILVYFVTKWSFPIDVNVQSIDIFLCNRIGKSEKCVVKIVFMQNITVGVSCNCVLMR